MTYEELKKQIQNINFAYNKDLQVSYKEQSVHIGDADMCYAIISNRIPYSLYISGFGFEQLSNDNLRFDLLKAIYEFTQTPIDSRDLFPRFYISSKLTPDDDGRFLFKIGGNIDCLAWGEEYGVDSKFTQKEIDYICDKFNTNLSDFNIEEVEE